MRGRRERGGIIAFPLDPNPYQALYYRALAERGYRVRYGGCLTRSHAVTLVLLPFELLALRLSGWETLHVHWVFGFAWPGYRRSSVMRTVSQAWFYLVLLLARMAGLRIVWTAHNVLPHEPVFRDDLAARRHLVKACDLVLVHSQSALTEIEERIGKPRRSAVIGFAPSHLGVDASGLRQPGATEHDRHLLFFGKVRAYKGVEELLAAMAEVPEEVPISLTVAGECTDANLRSRLEQRALKSPRRVRLRLGHVPEDEMPRLMSEADAVVLPFRKVTSSGSAFHALSYGRPLVIPRLRALEGLPNEATFRYDGTVAGLAGALIAVGRADAHVLRAGGEAGSAFARSHTWDRVAEKTAEALEA